jgi:hypothetical protein
MSSTCLTTMRVLHLYLEWVVDYSPILTNNLTFPRPSQGISNKKKLEYYYGETHTGLIPIPFDIFSIKFCVALF